MFNYDNRTFRSISNSDNGEVSSETVFHYSQEGEILTARYSGGEIVKGHLIGKVDQNGVINMRYHHINQAGELMTGKCISTPEMMGNGKLRLHESWEWTSGDLSKGTSMIVEE
ncbi:n-acetylglutamate synthase [Echinicola salinicaeni]|uniref:n-acetylglutamate synthase n=1 Tax=Echinicola salinicaeni TaxID=2762757 RepID=UPI001645CC5F|nr:n-acetylglutamate synthase [Echinicola salinicaeni]